MMGTLALFVYTQEYRIFMQFVRAYLPSTRTRSVNVLPSSYSPENPPHILSPFRTYCKLVSILSRAKPAQPHNS